MKKRLFSFILAMTLIAGSCIYHSPITAEAASKAKLKKVSVSLKATPNVKKQGNNWYMVKGTRTKINMNLKWGRYCDAP